MLDCLLMIAWQFGIHRGFTIGRQGSSKFVGKIGACRERRSCKLRFRII
jgi:hypothetical protein